MGKRYAQACEGDPRRAVACDGDARRAQACTSNLWFAAILAICGDSGGTGALVSVMSIRSTSPAGTVLSLNIQDPSAFTPTGVSFSVTVGTDTSFAWTSVGTFAPSGSHGTGGHIFMAAFPAPGVAGTSAGGFQYPNFDDAVGWAIPQSARQTNIGGPADATAGLGIHWRDSAGVVAAALGYSPGNWQTGNFGMPSSDNNCTPPYLDHAMMVLDDGSIHYQPTYGCAGDPAQLCGRFDDRGIAGELLWTTFPWFSFTPPAGPITVDTTFVLTGCQAYDAMSGLISDGSHTTGDDTYRTYDDLDVQPAIELVGAGVDESMDISSASRNSFGNYDLSGRFYCLAGTRKFNVFGMNLFGLVSVPSKVNHQSPGISVGAGSASNGYVDLPPPDLAFDTFYWRIGQPITIAARDAGNGDMVTNVVARILDRCGAADTFNRIPTATNSVTIGLNDAGGNAWTSPSLGGVSLTQAAVAGLADFTGLTATALGNNYSIALVTPSSPFSGAFPRQSTNANWHEFPVGFTTGLKFAAGPTLTVAHGVTVNLVVGLVDYAGTAINPTVQDGLTLAAGGSGFTGAGTLTPSGGLATFTGTFPTPGTYTLSVSTSGVTYYGPGTTYGTPPFSDPAVTISVTVT